MNSFLFRFSLLSFLIAIATPTQAQTRVIDDFDDDEWESTWVIQSNSVGSTELSQSDGSIHDLGSGGCHNGGIASIATFSPLDQGIRATFVLSSLTNPDTGELTRTGANGLFMGVVGGNDAFFRSKPNFGLVFFGNEDRTHSAEGFGLIAGDNNGGNPSDFIFDDHDVDPDSFSDGFSAVITANEAGWSYEIEGLLDIELNEVTFSNSGSWSDSGTSFQEVFGEDPDWHVAVSQQRCGGERILTSYDRIELVPLATSVVDDFDDDEWESTWVIQSNSVGSTELSQSDGSIHDLGSGSCHNGGIASIATFSPIDQGVRATFVLSSLTNPETGELARTGANGLFLGVVGGNDAFFRSKPNFGLVFFGNENRTHSGEGFGLIAGDNNGGNPSDFFFDDHDVDPDSFSDGFTAVITASEAGWSYEIVGLLDVELNVMTYSNSGSWADSGTSFQEVFGEDPDWYVAASQQSCGGAILTSYDRIALEPFEAEFGDADADGIPDFFEVANGLDPNADDAAADPDSDGLSNLAEFNAKTDPQNRDSDGDGLDDGVETGTGVWVSASDTGTQPLEADSDGDTLPDGAETNTGSYTNSTNTGTDPNQTDSDRDGSSDGFEVAKESDPTDLESRPEFDIEEALIGHYKFDETSGSLARQSVPDTAEVHFDFEFFDWDAEIVNGSGNSHWTDWKIGGAVELGGPDATQFFIIPDYPEPRPESVSVSAWVLANTLGPSRRIVVNGHENVTQQFDLGLSADGDKLHVAGRTSNGDVSVLTDTSPFPMGEWQHVAYVFRDNDPEENMGSGGRVSLYRNGDLVATLPTTEGPTGASTPFISIGALLDPEGLDFALDSEPGFWDGKIDDFGFWARDLAAEEVRGIYEAGLSGNDLTSAKAPEVPEAPVEPVEPVEPVVPVPPVVLPPVPGMPAEPTDFTVRVSANGDQVSISWESAGVKLQSTSSIGDAGSWTDVAGATSPYSEAASAEARFFRVVAQ